MGPAAIQIMPPLAAYLNFSLFSLHSSLQKRRLPCGRRLFCMCYVKSGKFFTTAAQRGVRSQRRRRRIKRDRTQGSVPFRTARTGLRNGRHNELPPQATVRQKQQGTQHAVLTPNRGNFSQQRRSAGTARDAPRRCPRWAAPSSSAGTWRRWRDGRPRTAPRPRPRGPGRR